MYKVELTKLIEAGAHFGHLTRRWNPKMKPYIFMERKGIHIIDLKKTQSSIQNSANKLNELVSAGKTVLFVGTKKQAKGIVSSEAKRCEMNWVSERWLGGMLTNFSTIRKSIKRLQNIDKMESDGTFEKITKKEQLFLTREKDKLRKVLEGIEHMRKIPGALFVVDIKKESIAIKEALRLNIPIFAIVDTNCDPAPVDYLIPANDDAGSTIELITKTMADAVIEGLQKHKEVVAQENAEKERERKEQKESKELKRGGRSKVRRVKFDSKGGKKVEKEEIVDKRKEEKAASDKDAEKVNVEEVKTEKTTVEKPADEPVKDETKVVKEKAESSAAEDVKVEKAPAKKEEAKEEQPVAKETKVEKSEE